MEVFTVELRVRAYEDLDDCLDVHIASSLEKAVAWCQGNLDYHSKDDLQPWVFFICSDIVDSNRVTDTHVRGCVGWDGVFATRTPAYYLNALPPGRAD